jgi:putative protease
MSPAGYWPQAHAAIDAGADSVYFGLKHFTARAKAGFSVAELPELMRTLHARGVRGYLTFNTLVFDDELALAARTLAQVAEAGVDAIIVQDLAVLDLARGIVPDLELHASTQMSITDANGAVLAASRGVQRVTLARELSIKEIKQISEQTGLELEVFVHGALCVAYSGQCFSSEAWGGRSANRGQCAQACRLPYEMFVDGALRPLGEARYLLSPGDLYALHQIPELIEAGVSAFKIEGRYKDEDYVAAATRAYRAAVDDAWSGRAIQITRAEELDLEQVYSRGLGPYFVSGTNHQRVVEGSFPRHRGVLIGKVIRMSASSITIQPEPAHKIAPMKPGDGVFFDASLWRSPQEKEEGGRVYSVDAAPGGKLEVSFGNGAIEFSRIRAGDRVWRSDDPALQKRIKGYAVHKQSVNVVVEAVKGQPLKTVWTLGRHKVEVSSPEPLSASRNQPLSADAVRKQLDRLGNTSYQIDKFSLTAEGQPFVPSSLLNQVRRDAVEKLVALQQKLPDREVREPEGQLRSMLPNVAPTDFTGPPEIHMLVRSAGQLDAAIQLRPASITLDYLDLYGLQPSVQRVRGEGIAVRVASPRILKPGEEKITEFLLRLDCPLLIRPAGLLQVLASQGDLELTGDFSLNAANAITAHSFLEMGLKRIAPTHDLNAQQVAALARSVDAARIEVIAYHHLPVFHTEHCVFCRFLSKGTTYLDCGRPCESHRVELRDENGRLHPLMADTGCRNTIFGAEAQEASRHMKLWLDAGIRHFRLEFVHESPEQVTSITEAFRDALLGVISYRDLQTELRKLSPQGTTEGSLFVPASHPALTVLP